MDDPYLNELRDDFEGYSNQLKKLKKKLLKTNSPELQGKIIKQIDSIAITEDVAESSNLKRAESNFTRRQLKIKDLMSAGFCFCK